MYLSIYLFIYLCMYVYMYIYIYSYFFTFVYDVYVFILNWLQKRMEYNVMQCDVVQHDVMQCNVCRIGDCAIIVMLYEDVHAEYGWSVDPRSFWAHSLKIPGERNPSWTAGVDIGYFPGSIIVTLIFL